MTHVPDVAVSAVNFVGGRRDWNIAFFGVSNGIVPRPDIPLAPGRDDFKLRRESFVSELEANLIIAFAGAAMRHGVSAFFERDFNLTFRK